MSEKVEEKENIERVNQVMEIVQRKLEEMIDEIWNTAKPDQQTRVLGSALTDCEEYMARNIINEMVTINACD